MERIFLGSAFLFSALLCPWWVTLFLGIVSLAFFRAYALVIFGGFLMDLLFSSPEPQLLGFSYIYTLVFLVLALTARFLDRSILE